MKSEVSELVKSPVKIDAAGVYYRDLNARLREITARGESRIEIHGVCGQRYIGTDLEGDIKIDVHGTPGNDLGAFMKGPRITVFGNAQDGCGNTMDAGSIVVHGHAGDVAGLSARGGEIYVREDVGYRAGIHMKEYQGKRPCLVIGGTAQDFLGEYMAGGVILLLGTTLEPGESHHCSFVGTGMHGGVIYIRGRMGQEQLGAEVGMDELDASDEEAVTRLVLQYCSLFRQDPAGLLQGGYMKLYPRSLRPYGRLYAY